MSSNEINLTQGNAKKSEEELFKPQIDSKGNSKFRIVTHLDFNEQDIETVVSAIKSII